MMKEEWINRRKEAARRMQESLSTLFEASIHQKDVSEFVEIEGVKYPKKAGSAASIINNLCYEFVSEVLEDSMARNLLSGKPIPGWHDFREPNHTVVGGCLVATIGPIFGDESKKSQWVFIFTESENRDAVRRSLTLNPDDVVFEVLANDRSTSTFGEREFEVRRLENGTISFSLASSTFCNTVMKKAFIRGLHTLERMFSPSIVAGMMNRRVAIAATRVQRRRIPFGPLTQQEHARREMKSHVSELLDMYPNEALNERTLQYLSINLCSKKIYSQFGSLKNIMDSVEMARVFQKRIPGSQNTSFDLYKHEIELPLYRALSKEAESPALRKLLKHAKPKQLLAHPLIHPVLSEGMTEHLIVGFVITSKADSFPSIFVERGDVIPYSREEQIYLDNITAQAELPLATEGLALFNLGLAHVVHRSQVSEVLCIADAHGWQMFNKVLRHLYSWGLSEHILDVQFVLSFLDGLEDLKEHYPELGRRREAFEQNWV